MAPGLPGRGISAPKSQLPEALNEGTAIAPAELSTGHGLGQRTVRRVSFFSGRGLPAPALVKITIFWQTRWDLVSYFPVACLMLTDPASVLCLSATYRQFAEQEAAGRSPLYATLCQGIAGDHTLLEQLTVLPLEKQQPNLLLAAVKYLFGAPRDWLQFRELVATHWVKILDVISSHRTQTNEPARCATLLPLLALLPPPLALLEVGASAGLCLLPDRYSYNYGGRCVPPSPPRSDVPVFHCSANAATPIPPKNLEIVWRAGLDISPLDVTNANDRDWLRALVWPEEGERDRLLNEALTIASIDPPRVVRGDLRRDLRALAAEAPRKATLVIFHTAVLAYVRDIADRRAFADTVKSLDAQWISNESSDLFDQPNLPPRPWGNFLLSLNGEGIAYADAHGTAIDWFGETATNIA